MEVELNVDVNQQIVENDQTSSATVSNTGTNYEEKTITPPSGQIGVINSLYINVVPVPGVSSDSHKITLYSGSFNNKILEITSPYGNSLTIQGLSVVNGTPVPASDISVASILKRLRFSNSDPLVIRYTNNTSAPVTPGYSNPRTYDVQYVAIAETSFL